jgi:hypothetical protein
VKEIRSSETKQIANDEDVDVDEDVDGGSQVEYP